MTAVRIDGTGLARECCNALKPIVADLKERGVTPCIHVLLAGNDPASAIYVRNKQKKAAELGLCGEVATFDENVDQAALVSHVRRLNADPAVHGILVQLPLPAHIDARAVLYEIAPEKDVDGLHPVNFGRLLSGCPGVIPCTPRGILALIESTNTPISGAHAVVVGRSNIVGKPVSILLQRANATVTMCHSYTKDLGAQTRRADILIAAAGHARLIRGDMIKPGAVVIDVGMNRPETGLCGDVAFDEAMEAAGYVTPVPGGVGPMTIAMLMRNTVEAAAKQAEGGDCSVRT